MDAAALSSSLVGFLAPFITQLVRRHVLPWSDFGAHVLAMVIAAGCVSIAYFAQGGHSFTGWLSSFGVAFTLSASIYRALHDTIDPEPAPVVPPVVPPKP